MLQAKRLVLLAALFSAALLTPTRTAAFGDDLSLQFQGEPDAPASGPPATVEPESLTFIDDPSAEDEPEMTLQGTNDGGSYGKPTPVVDPTVPPSKAPADYGKAVH
ncbi:hypothetical protein P43SY_005610 [Pythium insidiosum]|uniref:Uncharacterized protein n=1 Tax=Pythium insidiosum TaxID=114742 RepID=A0AAD5LZK0_PYTIN|nr:hypothetical protein P43SY_005610 [Pythium insidiosum]